MKQVEDTFLEVGVFLPLQHHSVLKVSSGENSAENFQTRALAAGEMNAIVGSEADSAAPHLH